MLLACYVAETGTDIYRSRTNRSLSHFAQLFISTTDDGKANLCTEKISADTIAAIVRTDSV